MRAYGGNPKRIELINPILHKWRIRWDIKQEDDGLYSFEEKDYFYQPSVDEIRQLINNYYNDEVNTKILNGFTWNDIPVWLSIENQLNYKSAFDLAVQTNGENLPVTFKFGTDDNPIYQEFTSIEELQDFYTKAMKFIQDTIKEGWKTKDEVDYNLYKVD